MECAATCTIRKNEENVKEFKHIVKFSDGKLTGYGDIIKKLQAEVNQALTDIVEHENAANTENTKTPIKNASAQGDQLDEAEDADDDDDNDEEDTPEMPNNQKHAIIEDPLQSPTKKQRKA